MMKNNWWSKLYRTLTSFLPVAKNRKGGCANCGACCQLPNRCFFLKFNPNGKSYCELRRKAGFNFLNCQKYPRTAEEWITPDKCGYRFE